MASRTRSQSIDDIDEVLSPAVDSNKLRKPQPVPIHKWGVVPSVSLLFLGTIIWVLQHAAILSKDIHDDHASYWVHTDVNNLEQWYNSMDACLLASPAAELYSHMMLTTGMRGQDNGSFIAEPVQSILRGHHMASKTKAISNKTFTDFVIHQNTIMTIESEWSQRCSKKIHASIGDNALIQRQIPSFCQISLDCTPPYATRHFFLKELHPKLTGHIPRRAFSRHLFRLSQDSSAFVFIGDLMTKQSVEALFCEVTKVDSTVRLIGNLSSLENVRLVWTNASLASTQHHPSLAVYYVPFDGIRAVGDILTGNHSKHQSRHRTSFSELKLKVDEIISSHPGQVTVVASMGSSYFSRMKFRDDIGIIMDWLEVIGEKTRVFFRENAAQHWNFTDHGYQTADSASGSAASVLCTPLADAHSGLDWRNREVQAYVRNENLHNIHFIPFRNITAPLYNMHIRSRTPNTSLMDCTNYCYFPQLWQILWTHFVEKVDI